MRIFNTLTKQIDEFEPLEKVVKMYGCGPTVYDVIHLGNMRTYLLLDVLWRSLEYLNYKVKVVGNITDVGHLVSDADEGEDKIEQKAKNEKRKVKEIVEKYTKQYLEDIDKLNIRKPMILCRVTEYIEEQIELIKKLEEKGFVYVIDDGVYFDTSKLDNYGQLVDLKKKELKAGARVEINLEKRQVEDFALWKFSPKDQQREMEWESPWGIGFPGWHLECSAMILKELGEQIDIHTGGVDLKFPHHTNEIAQSEAVTGKRPFAKYWVHGEFLLVDGEKMSKSKNNFYNLSDVVGRGLEPLAVRYLMLQSHYRKQLNFTWTSLEAAAKGLERLKERISSRRIRPPQARLVGILGWQAKVKDQESSWEERFRERIRDDLDMPGALVVLQGMLDSELGVKDKLELVKKWDEVLGLDLVSEINLRSKEDQKVEGLIEERDSFRKEGQFEEADKIRGRLIKLGVKMQDRPVVK